MSQRTRPACDGCGTQTTPGCGWRVRIRPDGKSYCPTCREADPLPPKSEHCCIDCGQVKPISDFYFYKGSRGRPSPSGPCKSCILARSRLKKYGVTQEQVDRMYLDQAGCCAICDHPMGVPHLDHCHISGEARGLLCNECNTGLGMFADDIERMARAINYLRGSRVLGRN